MILLAKLEEMLLNKVQIRQQWQEFMQSDGKMSTGI